MSNPQLQIVVDMKFDLMMRDDGSYAVHMRDNDYRQGIRAYIGDVRWSAGCWEGWPKNSDVAVIGQFMDPQGAAIRMIQILLQRGE